MTDYKDHLDQNLGHYVLGPDNKPRPVTMREYIDAMKTNDSVTDRVALTVVQGELGDPNCIHVSTVFLRLDHGMRNGRDAPLLWETMVFGSPMDQYCVRYSNHEAALLGHEDMVRRVRASLTPHGEAALSIGGDDALDAVVGHEDGE